MFNAISNTVNLIELVHSYYNKSLNCLIILSSLITKLSKGSLYMPNK